MKYFNSQMWLGVNSKNKKIFQKAEQLWDANYKKYHLQLSKLKNQLGSKNYKFINSVSLHDGSLVSVDLKRGGAVKAKNFPSSNWTVEIVLIEAEKQRRVKLVYEKVRAFQMDYPEKAPLFDSNGDIGDWGYDEWTRSDNGLLQHEVLFSTGATIKIVFEKLRIGFVRA